MKSNKLQDIGNLINNDKNAVKYHIEIGLKYK